MSAKSDWLQVFCEPIALPNVLARPCVILVRYYNPRILQNILSDCGQKSLLSFTRPVFLCINKNLF